MQFENVKMTGKKYKKPQRVFLNFKNEFLKSHRTKIHKKYKGTYNILV